MEVKTKCLVLSGVDSGENDKIITALTEDLGKIKIKVKGVKKQAAKFKFAAQPFCFMEAVLSVKAGYYTLINSTNVDSFSNILFDYEKLKLGYLIIETADKLTIDHANVSLPLTLRALGEVCYGSSSSLFACCCYLCRYIISSGYLMELDSCITCGSVVEIGDKVALSIIGGGIKCQNCLDTSDVTVRRSTYDNLKKVRNIDFDNLDSLDITEGDARILIGLYIRIIEAVCGAKIVSRDL